MWDAWALTQQSYYPRHLVHVSRFKVEGLGSEVSDALFVYVGPSIWRAWALLRSKVDGIAPHTPHTNLQKDGQLKRGRDRSQRNGYFIAEQAAPAPHIAHDLKHCIASRWSRRHMHSRDKEVCARAWIPFPLIKASEAMNLHPRDNSRSPQDPGRWVTVGKCKLYRR